MCSRSPDQITVPTKLADFMWHSHMQDHEAYVADTKMMLGRMLNHIDDFSEE